MGNEIRFVDKEVLARNLIKMAVATSTRSTTDNTLKAGLTPYRAWRMKKVFFSSGSSFISPEMVNEIEDLKKFVKKSNGLYSIFGHSDPGGDEELNKKISGRRALSFYGLLIRDALVWQFLYQEPVFPDDWGKSSLEIMWKYTYQHDEATFPEQEYLDDGQKRESLFIDYMDKLCGKEFNLKEGDFLYGADGSYKKGKVQGCGSFNPVRIFSEKDNDMLREVKFRSERNFRNAPNRRVMIFEFPMMVQLDDTSWKCPGVLDASTGCKTRFFSDWQTRRMNKEEERIFPMKTDTFCCRLYDRLVANKYWENFSSPLEEETVFDWHELWFIKNGASLGKSILTRERIFFIPEFDSTIPIKEGPTATTSWEGYHAGKHGVYERFSELKSQNMGEIFFNEKYRWIRQEYLNDPNTLKFITEEECKSVVDTYFKKPSGDIMNLKGIFDSEKFTKDLKSIADQHLNDRNATIWQGRYAFKKKDAQGNITAIEPDRLQTNIDFEANGQNWRLALDAETGQALNFFKIDDLLPIDHPNYRKPMEFTEIRVLWEGKITNVEIHRLPGSSFEIKTSATWKGLITQGMKSGSYSGGIAGAFLGAIDGFKKEGIPGALRGFALGALSGAAAGAVFGGINSLVSKVAPSLQKIEYFSKAIKLFDFAAIFLQVFLEPTDIAKDPEEFNQATTDNEGNLWRTRHVEKHGTMFPDLIPHGIVVFTKEGAIIQMGENEWAGDSSFDYEKSPLLFAPPHKKIDWFTVKTPEGSSTWWWMDRDSKEERIMVFDSDEAINIAIQRSNSEKSYWFAKKMEFPEN